MGFIQIVKEFFMKKSYDFENPNIDLYHFHPQLRVFLAPMGIFFNNKDSWLRFIWPTLCVLVAIPVSSLEFTFVLHGIQVKDYALATECFCYLLMLGVMLLVSGSMLLNRTNVMQILNGMNEDFLYICKLDSRYRFIWPTLCVLVAIPVSSLEFTFVLHGIQVKDYALATECFCYLLMLGVMLLVSGSMLLNRTNVMQILNGMNEDFLYICKLDSRYRNYFLSGQLQIWKLCFTWLWFTIFVGVSFVGMTILPLIYLSLFGTIDEHTVRPFIFPVYLSTDDPYRTPNYEIFLILEIVFVFLFIQIFCVYVYVQFHVLLHNINLLGLIILDFEVIFEGLDESAATLPRYDARRVAVQRTLNSRMKRIVTWHLSVFRCIDTLSSVQGAPLVYQVMFSSTVLCLMWYQVAEKLDHGKVDFLFVILTVACILQLGIPCYLGTILRNKAFAVGDACWNCGWHETSLGQLLRTDILIFISRSQKPLSIQFTGLPQLSLETFSSIMTTAYSYLNMLRQYN